jgi:hypothetical protein
MRKLTLTFCAIALMMAAGTAMAADASGTWVGQTGGAGGGGMTITFHFKQDGAKLTGTVDVPQADPVPIGDGKVDGNKVSFTLKIEFGGETMKITHEGAFAGDEMKLNTKMEGGPASGTGGPLTLTRSK